MLEVVESTTLRIRTLCGQDSEVGVAIDDGRRTGFLVGFRPWLRYHNVQTGTVEATNTWGQSRVG